MKLSTMAVVLALCIPCLCAAQSVEQQLKKLEVVWGDAGIKKDFAALDRVVADDYSSIDEVGNVQTKAQGIAALKSGEDVNTSQVLSDMKVRVYGDAAVKSRARLSSRGRIRANRSAVRSCSRMSG